MFEDGVAKCVAIAGKEGRITSSGNTPSRTIVNTSSRTEVL
jgi:hypothetical protein